MLSDQFKLAHEKKHEKEETKTNAAAHLVQCKKTRARKTSHNPTERDNKHEERNKRDKNSRSEIRYDTIR